MAVADTRAEPGAEAFELVHRSERDRLRRVAYLMTRRADVADELVHDAFVQAMQPSTPDRAGDASPDPPP